jgi:ATP-dependent Clp protease adaptor protein ClpS
MTTEAPVIEEKQTVKKKFKEPKKYNVVVMNDNFTPMEFVIAMLMTIFKHDQNRAVDITLKIHNDGSAVAGSYSHEIAEQKSADAIKMARSHGHPLLVKVD